MEHSGNLSQKQELLTRLNEKRRAIQILVKPSKKPPAPKPPPRMDDGTPPNGVSPSFDLRPIVSQQNINDEREQSSPSKTPIVTNNVTYGMNYLGQISFINEMTI